MVNELSNNVVNVGDKIEITSLYMMTQGGQVHFDYAHEAVVVEVDAIGEIVRFTPDVFGEDILVLNSEYDVFTVVEEAKESGDTDKPQTYIAGDLLSFGAQLQRKQEAEELRRRGAKLHVPHEDESINDKANAVQEGLAERIVANDTKGIIESDIVVIDAHENGKGTLVELGQLKGMRDQATIIDAILTDYSLGDCTADEALRMIDDEVERTLGKLILPHNTDIRRQNKSLQQGDRREYGVNQYVHGVALDLTYGRGFYELDEIYDLVEAHYNDNPYWL